MDDFPITFSTLQSHSDPAPRTSSATWGELSRLLTRHTASDTKNGPCWSPSDFNGKRGAEFVTQISCMVLDFDKGVSPLEFRSLWEDYEFIAHSTYQHTATAPRWRAVFPLSKPVPANEWDAEYLNLGYALGRFHFDGLCADVAHIYYLPSCPPDSLAESFVWAHPGDPVYPASFPKLTIEQRAKLKRAVTTYQRGRTSSESVDYKAIVEATIPQGLRHNILTRGIYRARKEGWERSAIEAIIDIYHENEKRGYPCHSTKAASLKFYRRDIARVWEKVTPNG